ncbi:hypothetical protein NDA13_002332 [Ustilago tritici]|nr:hypothetical protein NDA13_002332 [Ustilago tritici]
MEPDPDSFTTTVTGKHIWAARRNNTLGPNARTGPTAEPLVPFEDLPFPRSDRAKIAACTIRWQFTDCFSINKEENSTHGSITVQVKRFLEFKGFTNPIFTVNFPRGVGRGRFVDICVDRTHMAAIVETPLVYRAARLERHLIGPALPRTAMVAEISNFSENEDIYRLAQTVAIFLHPFARVHDIWTEMHAIPGDTTHSAQQTRWSCLPRLLLRPPADETLPGSKLSPDISTLEAYTAKFSLATVLPCVIRKPGTQMTLARLWLKKKASQIQRATQSSTTVKLKLSSGLTVATWNCASLNNNDCIAALHDRSQPLGKADIVLLQEMRLAAPDSLPLQNPLLRLHHPFSSVAHQAVLGKDAGIIIRNTNWVIETSLIHDYFVYACVRIPEPEPAVGHQVRLLHIWSIHAPPSSQARNEFWNTDAPELSRIDAYAMNQNTGAIVGADRNAVHSPFVMSSFQLDVLTGYLSLIHSSHTSSPSKLALVIPTTASLQSGLPAMPHEQT